MIFIVILKKAMEKTKGSGNGSSDEDFESADESASEPEIIDLMKPEHIESVDDTLTQKCHVDSSSTTNAVKPTQDNDNSLQNIEIEKKGSIGEKSKENDKVNEENEVTTPNDENATTSDSQAGEKVDENISFNENLTSNNLIEQPSKESNVENESLGWGWGGWGAVLNQATASVTSGLSQVIESVETTLGIPEPGEMVDERNDRVEPVVVTAEPKSIEIERNETDSCNDCNNPVESASHGDGDSDSYLSYWGLSNLSNAVTAKGMELVSEGIDALEVIGKKTMNVISEGDPGLRSKRTMFQKSSLSEVLREAKEKSIRETNELKNQEVLESVNFNDEFDRFQGAAHLEALEILSKECEVKIESVLMDTYESDLGEIKSKLRDIESVFQQPNPVVESTDIKECEFAIEVGNCAMALNLAFVPDKLNQTEAEVTEWLENCCKEQQDENAVRRSHDEIYSHVITSLADLTAKSIEVFRKVAEMMLLVEGKKDVRVSAKDRALHLRHLTKTVTDRIASLSARYAQCLNTTGSENDDCDNITPIITEVYLESSNSTSYVLDAFKLLLPVLQVSYLNDIE